jgi:flagellar biosynthesis/type III secretory pathway M-ring protein FliF/YscJ
VYSYFRCKCKYEIRNLSVMKVVVILVIWVISILVIYMGFLSCLEPMLTRGKSAPNPSSYTEHHEEETEDEEASAVPPGAAGGVGDDGTQMRTYGSNVINRVGDQQTRWKKQVQEQRKNIYDRHSMLN